MERKTLQRSPQPNAEAPQLSAALETLVRLLARQAARDWLAERCSEEARRGPAGVGPSEGSE